MSASLSGTDFLPFCLPDIGEEEISEVVDALRSGWLTTGPKVKSFENAFGSYMGSGVEALAVNSATAGLHLALEAAGIGPGDEVITSTFTFTATAEIIRYLGGHPVFVDVDAFTLNMDPESVERAITPRTKALIPVHFGGLSCDMAALIRLARRHGLKIIEDAAHSLPATCGGKKIGTLETDATVFSFYATKNLTTGEGGMVVSRDPSILNRCKTMRLHGIDRDAFGRYTDRKPAWFYQVVAPGFKYNMTDIAAAIGIHQLRKLERFQRRREELVKRYDEGFENACVQRPAHAPTGEMHAWHLYAMRLNPDASLSRDTFIDRMSAAGIGTSVHFIPLHLHPYWRDTYGLKEEQFPVATRAYKQIVSLPLHTRLTNEEQERVIETAVRLLRGGSGTVVSVSGEVPRAV